MAAAPTKTAPKPTAAPPAKTRPAVTPAKAPAVQVAHKSGLVKVPQAVAATYDKDYVQLQKDIDALERSVGLMTTGLVQEGFVKNAIHTGVLNYDFVVGGGAAPACMTVIPGLSGSGKSTVVDNLAALCCFQDIPVFWYDAEAALDPSYVSRIFARYGLNLHDLMGRRDAKGNWEVYPRIRYSNDSGGERIFKMMAGVCDLLPKIKRGMDGHWYRQVLVKGQQPKWEEDPRQGKPQYLFIVDSWPALLPEARENNSDASPMASQARMISAYMNIIKSPIAMTNSVLYSVNQIRTKPGVVMGCLHADTVIPLVDGRNFTIREIVDEQIEGQVWSFNESTKAIEPKNITGWHDNGLVETADDWITVKGQAVDTTNGAVSFTVTPDHEVKIGSGSRWKPAKSVKVGDKLLTKRVCKLNGTLLEFMLGKFVGDISLYADKRAGNAQFKLANSEQPDYLVWTAKKLSAHYTSRIYIDKRGFTVHAFAASSELRIWHEKLQARRSFRAVSSQFTALSLAVWYMDDGCLIEKTPNCHRATVSFKRFRNNPVEAKAVSDMLFRFGIEHTISPDSTHASITVAGARTLCALIAEYVPEFMQYKLVPEFRGRYREFDLRSTPTYETVEVRVLAVTRGNRKKFAARRKFDITVEDNHNYMAGNTTNGVIVHNSPEYEPAGAALEFYADVRTQLRKVAPSTIKAGTGQYTEEPSWHGNGVDKYVYARIKNTKNKKFTPFRESTIRIAFERDGGPGDGICRTWDVMQFLLATGQAVARNGRLEINLMPSVAKGKAPPIPHGTLFTKPKFKHLVEAPQNKDGLYQHCLRQIRSGYAFEIERTAVRALITHDSKAETAAAADGFGDDDGLEA